MLRIIDLRQGKDSDIFERLADRESVGRQDVVEKVLEILENVRKNGDRAVLEYTRKFDGVDLMPRPCGYRGARSKRPMGP